MISLHKRKIKGYGWKPSLPDFRDRKLPRQKIIAPSLLPPLIDLTTAPQYFPVYDQGDMGSCTANSLAFAVQYERDVQNLPPLGANGIPSRLFIYYGERTIEGSTGYDSGANLRDGLKVLATQGVCDESDWPYLDSNLLVQPEQQAYTDAAPHVISAYYAVTQTQEDICGALAGNLPVVFGFTVYESFESAAVESTGFVPMPIQNETAIGGHAVVIVGYDIVSQFFKVRNSWGQEWGIHGHFWMPFEYVLNPALCDDFWAIQLSAA